MMNTSTDESRKQNWQTSRSCAFPSVMWVMPVIGVSILLSSQAVVTSTVPAYLPYLCGIQIIYWTYYVRKVHQILASESGGKYPISPWRATWQTLIGGTGAAFVTTGLLWGVNWALDHLSRTIMELLPSDLPIIQTAQMLLIQRSYEITLSLCFGIIFYTHCNLAACLTSYLKGEPPSQWTGLRVSRLNPPGVLVSILLAVPACMWLLNGSPIATSVGLEQDWLARVYLACSVCMFTAFCVTASIVKALPAALIARQKRVEELGTNTSVSGSDTQTAAAA